MYPNSQDYAWGWVKTVCTKKCKRSPWAYPHCALRKTSPRGPWTDGLGRDNGPQQSEREGDLSFFELDQKWPTLFQQLVNQIHHPIEARSAELGIPPTKRKAKPAPLHPDQDRWEVRRRSSSWWWWRQRAARPPLRRDRGRRLRWVGCLEMGGEGSAA